MTDYISPFLGAQTDLPTKEFGTIRVEVARLTDAVDGDLVIHVGEPFDRANILVRIHSACLFSEVLGSTFCDCDEQLHMAMARLREEGSGLLFYQRFDGRGAGLAAKVAATKLEMEGVDTHASRVRVGVAPDGRSFSQVAEWLKNHGAQQVRLLTNNPDKSAALEKEGLTVIAEPLLIKDPNDDVVALYRAKAEQFGHDIPRNLFNQEQEPG
jgi:GTP cyclohydrolase II